MIKKKINYSNIDYIVFDMDGTSLTDMKKVDKELASISKQLTEKGIKFVLATGRMKEMTYLFMEHLGMNDALIASCNGGDIGYKEHNKREKDIFLSLFPIDITKKIIEEANKLNLLFHIFSTHGMISAKSAPRLERYLKLNESLKEEFKTPVLIGEKYLTDEYLKNSIKFFMDGTTLSQVETFINNIKKYNFNLEIVFSGEKAIDVNMPGINKGTALKILNDKKIIDLEKTMAFGDNYNDIPMFKVVKYPIAMGNAKEETRKYALDVCDTNNNCGAGKYLKKLFNLQ